jgi:hypothetical protein
MKYLNNLCTSIGLTLIYIFVIRILDFHPSDLPFLLLHFIARFIIARSEIRRSLVSALNRNTTTKMTSYFCEIDLSYASWNSAKRGFLRPEIANDLLRVVSTVIYDFGPRQEQSHVNRVCACPFTLLASIRPIIQCEYVNNPLRSASLSRSTRNFVAAKSRKPEKCIKAVQRFRG